MNSNAIDEALPSAIPCGLSLPTIERVASHFRKVVGDESISDMQTLLHGFKCKLEVVAPEVRRLDVHGTLEVRGPDDWTVFLPTHTGPLQDRFTLAHELGHFVLHSKMGQIPIRAFRTFCSTAQPNPAEAEADAFAMALLMPARLVQEAMKTYGSSPALLSAVFEVTPEVAAARLETLEMAGSCP